MTLRNILAGVMLGGGATGALAQQVDQISPASSVGEAVQQISGGERQAIAQTPALRRDLAPPAQLSSDDENRAHEPQLTSEGRSVRTPLQLYKGGRTAQPSQALSRPSEGRTAAVAPVGGTDRCDKASDDAAQRAACARVIETRSAEFERPDPVTLSPEQRLLVEQRLREAPARSRLTSSGLDPNAIVEQAVASLTLRPAPLPERDERKDDLTAAQAAAAAIVNAIVSGAGQPAPNGP